MKALYLFLSCLLLVACKEKRTLVKRTNQTDSLVSLTKHLKTPASHSAETSVRPIWGYRFEVEGDFDGDGKKELLTEHYISLLTNKEINKFFDLDDYDSLVAITESRKPYSFLLSTNKHLDTVVISSNTQLFGLSLLKNEGDLDGDGADELSYVVNWADWSNLNTWHILSFKKGRWREIYSFSIWDWQLPDLPESATTYGPFGTEAKQFDTTHTYKPGELPEEWKNFKGLVTKLGNGKIRIRYSNDEAEEAEKVVYLK